MTTHVSYGMTFRNLTTEAWALRFGIDLSQPHRIFTDAFCWQLCRCRSDEARRLLLGVSQ